MSSHLEQELRQQPKALARLIEKQLGYAEQVRELFLRDDVQYILIASRGSSSNAAPLCAIPPRARLPRARGVRDAVAVHASMNSRRVSTARLVIGISQSGKSPDVVEVVTEARRQGRPTIRA